MGDNNATVSAKVMTPYGSGQVIRTNPKDGQEVTVHPDGTVTVKSLAPIVLTNFAPIKLK